MTATRQGARTRQDAGGQLSLDLSVVLTGQKTAGKILIVVPVQRMDVIGMLIHFQLAVAGAQIHQTSAGPIQHYNLIRLHAT